MQSSDEMQKERERVAHVQQLLYAAIEQSQDYSGQHSQTIRQLLTDAWDELRLKPTALSEKDIEQLSIDVNRYLARKAFNEEQVRRSEKMLLSPYFARVDFREEGTEEPEEIVIGLYLLRDENSTIVVHDWRAPICSLYYDAKLGAAAYDSPQGKIAGQLLLKRQYKMENGKLVYYVDTDVSIDDEMLLDILSTADSRHMRQIVSTIQKEQNDIIRLAKEPVVCVIGVAGSGKTSVALHRASYQLYHNRDSLEAAQIEVISPSTAFIDYISNVLPDLGEENVRSRTMHGVMKSLLRGRVESPLEQNEIVLTEQSQLRLRSIVHKRSEAFLQRLLAFAQEFAEKGPEFLDIRLGKSILLSAEQLTRLYRQEFRFLSPALRLTRIKSVLESRRRDWERTLKKEYEQTLGKSHRGRDLDIAVQMAVSQRLRPVRMQIEAIVSPAPQRLYAEVLSEDAELHQTAIENAEHGIVWWEDAPAIAYLALALGFAKPEKGIKELIIDEAQDYSEIALRTMRLCYPAAQVTILGDPNQQTTPLQGECLPGRWGACFGAENAPVAQLLRSYRSTLPIAALLEKILPTGKAAPIGRKGEVPLCAEYSRELLQEKLSAWQGKGMRSSAIITRTTAQARALHKAFPETLLLTHEDDMLPEDGRCIIACYHLLKGLEFDAVAVVWPETDLTEEERRRLYTACSRALHDCCLFAGKAVLKMLAVNHADL